MRDLRSEFSTSKVVATMDGDNLVLKPSDDFSRLQAGDVLAAGENRRLWHFMGADYNDSRTKDLLVGAYYACGGKRVRVTKGNVEFSDYRGALKIYLDLSGTEDMQARYAVRDFGYLSGGMIVLDGSTADRVLLAPKSKCKVCGGPLASSVELEWSVCNTCYKVCQHIYKEGVCQANGNLAWLPFCIKCGRGDPAWKPSDEPDEDLVKLLTKDGGLAGIILQSKEGTTVLSRR